MRAHIQRLVPLALGAVPTLAIAIRDAIAYLADPGRGGLVESFEAPHESRKNRRRLRLNPARGGANASTAALARPSARASFLRSFGDGQRRWHGGDVTAGGNAGLRSVVINFPHPSRHESLSAGAGRVGLARLRELADGGVIGENSCKPILRPAVARGMWWCEGGGIVVALMLVKSLLSKTLL